MPSYDAVGRAIANLKRESDLPIAVGFGVKTAESAAEIVRAGADAAVVGSAIVDRVKGSLDGQGRATAATVEAVASLVRELAAGVRSAANANA